MTTSIRSEPARSVVVVNGVDTMSVNADGSVELLVPNTSPSGQDVVVANQVVGIGQSWQNLAGSRAIGTTYTNDTGRPITVGVTIVQGASGRGELRVGGVVVGRSYFAASTDEAFLSAVVPAGASYSYNITVGVQTLANWAELR